MTRANFEAGDLGATADVVEPARAERRGRAGRSSELGEAVRLQRAISSCLFERRPELGAVVLPRERARAKTAAGLPVLHGEQFHVAPAYVADVFGKLIRVLESFRETSECSRQLTAALTDHRLHVDHLVLEAVANHTDHLAQIAASAGVGAAFLVSVAEHCARPMLVAYARRVGPAVDVVHWGRGYCPVCGGWPIIGQIVGQELTGQLRCGRCGAGWPAKPLQCPFCGNHDRRTVRSMTLEDEGHHRVDCCDRCRGYLKVMRVLAPTPVERLAVEDADCAHLDEAAAARGYERPSEPGFRLVLADVEVELDDHD